MAKRGLEADDRVDIVTLSTDGVERACAASAWCPTRFPIGGCAAYYPETNPLVPLYAHDPESFTPASKGIPVRLVRLRHRKQMRVVQGRIGRIESPGAQDCRRDVYGNLKMTAVNREIRRSGATHLRGPFILAQDKGRTESVPERTTKPITHKVQYRASTSVTPLTDGVIGDQPCRASRSFHEAPHRTASRTRRG